MQKPCSFNTVAFLTSRKRQDQITSDDLERGEQKQKQIEKRAQPDLVLYKFQMQCLFSVVDIDKIYSGGQSAGANRIRGMVY